jgi:transcription elongation factor S-II
VLFRSLTEGNPGSSGAGTFPTSHLVYQLDDGDESIDLVELLEREGYSDEGGYIPPIGSCAYYRNRARKLISTAIPNPDLVRDAEQSIFRETIREAIRNNTGRTWKDPIVKSIYDIVFNRVYRNLIPLSARGSVGNPKLARLVIDGTIPAKNLGKMTPAQLWPEKWQDMEEERILRQIATLEVNMASSTDMFKCKKCKQNKCIYKEMQTRSADEPMTIFVFCLMCGNRWKE